MTAAIRQFIKRSPLAYRVALKGYEAYVKVSRTLSPPSFGAAESGSVNLPQAVPHVFECDQAKGAAFSRALEGYLKDHGEPFDSVRVVHLFHMLQAANKLPPGDYIELGTHRGFTLKVIHRFMDPAQHLYSFDTFEGFDKRDIEIERTKYASQWTEGNFLPTSAEGVASYVGDGKPPENLTMVKGWFPESFRGLEDRRWRFIHIDFDLYQPIKAALDILWDKLLPGGILLVHDYGCYGFPAARTAVDEFCEKSGILPIELGDRWGTAALRKPMGPR